MQTPEEFAIAVTENCPEVSDGMCFHSAPVGRCIDLKAAADLIRARDAEVRADERAKVLAGFEWEPDDCSMEFRTHGQNCQCFGPRTGPRVGRWVSPWEPVP